MHVAVAIASKGRPHILGESLEGLATQVRAADSVWIGVTGPEDVPGRLVLDDIRVVMSEAGLTIQRNALIDAIGDTADLIVFIDDDTELHTEFVLRAAHFAEAHPQVGLFFGEVVADGARGGEIERRRARALLAEWVPSTDVVSDVPVYGCMIVRASIARAERFDENLRHYGWLEDRDFSQRVARIGSVVRYNGCALVHLGVSSGRQSGLRLGFQQVVHPVYLHRKGVLDLRETVRLVARPVLANLAYCVLRQKGAVDRLGRLRGNARAFRGLLSGRAEPADVLHLT